jgi:hypothetical protein
MEAELYDDHLEVQLQLEESGGGLPPYPTAEEGMEAMAERITYFEKQLAAWHSHHPDDPNPHLNRHIATARENLEHFKLQLKSMN